MTSTDEPDDRGGMTAPLEVCSAAGRPPIGSSMPAANLVEFWRRVRAWYDRHLTARPTGPSYHDLHITTDKIPRTSILDLPYNIEVTCNRVGGWEVWDSSQNAARDSWRLLGGEYDAAMGDVVSVRLDDGVLAELHRQAMAVRRTS